MKKFLSLLLAVIMVLSLASVAVAEDASTLELWCIWSNDSESNKAPFLKTLDQFKEAHPEITVNLTQYDASEYDTIIKTAVAADEAPDVFYYNAGGMMKAFVDGGKLAVFNDYITDGTSDRIVEGTLTNMTFDGNVYGLPYTNACSIMFVNPALFEQYGIDLPTADWTWTQFVETCQKFIDNGVTPLALGAKDTWCICMYMDILMLRQCGHDEMESAFRKTGTFLTDNMKKAADKFVQLVQMGAFPEGAAGISRDESEVPFYNGQIPMYINGNWTAANCPEGYTCVPFPVIEDGAGVATDFMGGASEEFTVSSQSKNIDAAMTLCKYLAENHSYNAYVVGAGMPTWKFETEPTDVNPLIAQIVGYTNNATSFLLWGNTILEGDDSVYYGDRLQELVMGEITAEDFLNAMESLLK